MLDSVGVNHRIFDNKKFALDDIDHIQRYQLTRRGYIADHTLAMPNSKFEHESVSDNTHLLFTHAERMYGLPVPLGKKPEYLQQRIDELIPFGKLEKQMGMFPYSLKELQQKQFELNQYSLPDSMKKINVNGKQYSIDNVHESIAKSY